MAQVYIAKEDALAPVIAPTWALFRVGTGPFRALEFGFKTVRDAKDWAKKHGHEIVTLTAKDKL